MDKGKKKVPRKLSQALAYKMLVPAKNCVKILNDKTIKVKSKTLQIARLLLDGKISMRALVNTAKSQPDTNKATLLEAMEYASKSRPDVVDQKGFEFAIESLRSEAPRVKWESARLITNTAHLFPKLLKTAVGNLLVNTEHPGTVVRWSAAGALGKIIQCKTPLNKELIPTLEAIEKREADNAIRKIYQKALKKAT